MNADPNETTDAAKEAAQNVVDSVTSWNHSATPDTIEEELRAGLDEAQVSVPEGQVDQLVDDISNAEDGAHPEVTEAEPS